jgi:glycosyltransferase involved in cell wall biosynthesis
MSELPQPSGVTVPDLVSVCVPTFQRPQGLLAAVESVLRQDYAEFEVIICDNASADATGEVAAELCRRDARVRYLRHPNNLGPTRNFMSGLPLCRGSYFMWLADDDWLDPNYLSVCLGFLQAHPEHVLAGGRIRYYRQGNYRNDGLRLTLEEPDPLARVLRYYQCVADNGTFYGVMRMAPAVRVPFHPVIGGDWFFLAAMAFQGKIHSVDTTSIHRDDTWDRTSFQRIARHEGIKGFDLCNPHLTIAWNAHEDILTQPVYTTLSPGCRTRLAVRAFWTLCRTKNVRMCRAVPRLLRLLVQHGTALLAK